MFRKVFFIVLVALVLVGAPALAQEDYSPEHITSFDVPIHWQADGTLRVEENILYNFGSEEKHGIYRNIIDTYDARGGTYRLRIGDISVVDDRGKAYHFTTSDSGSYLQIKIGDADKYVDGEKLYKIGYSVRRAVNFFPNYDELYWNVTGNEWKVDIDQASGTVTLPAPVAEGNLQVACFSGKSGSTASCQETTLTKNAAGLVTAVRVAHSGLGPQEGITVVVGIPKGLVTPPSRGEVMWDSFRDNGILLLPFLVFIYLFRRWWRHGRDPKATHARIAQYEQPDGLSPGEMNVLLTGKNVQHKAVAAEIIKLAVDGFIKINRVEKHVLFIKKVDYRLEKLKSAPAGDQEKLLNALFAGKDEVLISDLKTKFVNALDNVKGDVYDRVIKSKGYFANNPQRVKIGYSVAGAMCIMLGFFFVPFWFGLYGLLSFFLIGLMLILFAFIMPARTLKGVEAVEYALGFKLFLSVTETERLKFHNAPEKNPALFEKYLPYAMVFGVETAWAKQFEGITTAAPSWYNDPSGLQFNSLLFASKLSQFHSSVHSAATYHTASSGGSGFSGGSSGGGFGGGGGGSW